MTEELQAALFYARERRSSLTGDLRLFRTHRYIGATAIAVPTIATGAVFPGGTLSLESTFTAKIRIDANGGVHRGLVFEFGDASRGIALWIGDQTIGFAAGGTGDDAAIAIFDNTAELPPGVILTIVASVSPSDGRIQLWANGIELLRAAAANDTFNGGWSSSADGSFASAPAGAVRADVPGVSAVTPDGFTIISPLSVYAKQLPREFSRGLVGAVVPPTGDWTFDSTVEPTFDDTTGDFTFDNA